MPIQILLYKNERPIFLGSELFVMLLNGPITEFVNCFTITNSGRWSTTMNTEAVVVFRARQPWQNISVVIGFEFRILFLQDWLP